MINYSTLTQTLPKRTKAGRIAMAIHRANVIEARRRREDWGFEPMTPLVDNTIRKVERKSNARVVKEFIRDIINI